MNIRRSYFSRNIEGRFKLIKIGEDKYIYVYSIKTILKSIFKLLIKICELPLGCIVYILSAIWDYTCVVPKYLSTILELLKNISPIEYIKVIDDKNIKKEIK